LPENVPSPGDSPGLSLRDSQGSLSAKPRDLHCQQTDLKAIGAK
jgi:hypothetical protein